MKWYKHAPAFLLLVFFVSCVSPKSVGHEEMKTGIAQSLEKQSFSVRVERASPQTGSAVTLTTYYTIDVDPKNLQAYLPYYGRATGVSGFGGTGPVMLKTSSFQIKKERMRHGWEIVITPEESDDVRLINMHISTDGFVNANFAFRNRTAMQYWGHMNPSHQKIDSSAIRQ